MSVFIEKPIAMDILELLKLELSNKIISNGDNLTIYMADNSKIVIHII